MAWMTVEAAIGIIAGIVASSIVLIGFGLDSVIEFFAAAVVVWQLRGTVSEERESRALRLQPDKLRKYQLRGIVRVLARHRVFPGLIWTRGTPHPHSARYGRNILT